MRLKPRQSAAGGGVYIELQEINRQHRASSLEIWLGVLNCFALLAGIGYLDYLTGYNISFFLFYLIPILYTLWRLGFWGAIAMCALSTGVWLAANAMAGLQYPDWGTPLWNGVLRFLAFVLITGLVAVRGKLEMRVRQSTDALNEEFQKRRLLEKEVLETSEREQRKIGHDLHDGLCQHLTAVALSGKVLAKKLAAESRPETAAANQLVSLIEQGIEYTRMLARSLHPMGIQSEGLSDGLEELAASIMRGFAVHCQIECSGTVSPGTAEANMHLYRIAQEAISNAIRHGHAKNITLRLAGEDDRIVFSIIDDGTGLPPDAEKKGGMGLNIMKYRAGMIGATLQFHRLPKTGTEVMCVVPVSKNMSVKSHVQAT